MTLDEGLYGLRDPVTSNWWENTQSYCGDCSDRMFFFPVVWTIQDEVASFTANDIFGTTSIWSVVIECKILKARQDKQKHLEDKLW